MIDLTPAAAMLAVGYGLLLAFVLLLVWAYGEQGP